MKQVAKDDTEPLKSRDSEINEEVLEESMELEAETHPLRCVHSEVRVHHPLQHDACDCVPCLIRSVPAGTSRNDAVGSVHDLSAQHSLYGEEDEHRHGMQCCGCQPQASTLILSFGAGAAVGSAVAGVICGFL